MFQTIYNALPINDPGIRRGEMALAFFQLSRLLSAGVSLSDALRDLAMNSQSGLRSRLWEHIATRVSNGKPLSEAFVENASKADKTIAAMLKAGEASGQLDSACEAIYRYLRWQQELRQRLYTLLIYPLFSLCVLLLVTGFLFVSVVPSIKGFLTSSGAVLEWHTLLLLAVSSWMNQYYLSAIVGGVVITILLVIIAGTSRRVQILVSRWLLRLPLIGKLVSDLALSRYTRCCAQLYANGVALESSMELAEGTVINRVICNELATARVSMIAGMSLAESLERVAFLPSLFVSLVRVGEVAGELELVLNQFGEHQEVAAEAAIKRIEQMIGPLMLMFVGAILLWIVVSVLGPVYNMAIDTVVGSV